MRIERTTISPLRSVWRKEWSHQTLAPSLLLSAFRGNCKVAELTFHYQPNQSVVLTPVTFLDPAETIDRRLAVEALLGRALQESRQRHASTVNLLPFVDWDSDFSNALLRHGFQQSGILQKWQRLESTLKQAKERSSPSEETEVKLSILATDGAVRDPLSFTSLAPNVKADGMPNHCSVSRNAMHELIGSILNSAEDFFDIAPSAPDVLLRLWELIDSELKIIVAVVQAVPVGLMIVNFQDTSPDAAHSRFSESLCSEGRLVSPHNGNRGTIIEYLGVHPQNRRRGIASQLLSSLQQFVARPANVSLFAAEANTSALAFYRRSGFSCVDSSALWVLDEP